jgi:hypothetical protein
MMNKFLLLLFALALVSVQALDAFAAGNPDTGPGCGLGKLAWQDYKGQKQIAPQVMMATTNGTFGSQTFGISFGTSGCTNDGVIMRTERTNVFVFTMFDNLSQEMAKGQGEHLASLATLMGVPPEHQAEFFALTQEKYKALVEAGAASPVAVIKAIEDAMAEHPVLAKVVAAR